MKTWKIINGDVAKDLKGRIEEANGAAKVVQDLRNWLLNYEGYNKFHPEMGTLLDDFVGQPVTPHLLADIRDEIRYALNLYMEYQMADIQQRIEERGDPYVAIGLAEPSSMVRRWNDLDVTQDGTVVNVHINFTTFTNDIGDVVLSLSSGVEQRSII